MSIKEYADSMNCTVQEILNKCRELGIKASDKDSFLEIGRASCRERV